MLKRLIERWRVVPEQPVPEPDPVPDGREPYCARCGTRMAFYETIEGRWFDRATGKRYEQVQKWWACPQWTKDRLPGYLHDGFSIDPKATRWVGQ